MFLLEIVGARHRVARLFLLYRLRGCRRLLEAHTDRHHHVALKLHFTGSDDHALADPVVGVVAPCDFGDRIGVHFVAHKGFLKALELNDDLLRRVRALSDRFDFGGKDSRGHIAVFKISGGEVFRWKCFR